jgi:predicted nucleic acid-binding protein
MSPIQAFTRNCRNQAIDAKGEAQGQKIRPLSPDPSDDMVLGIAINGRAEALVTSNTKHFAGLRRGLEFRCFLRRNF